MKVLKLSSYYFPEQISSSHLSKDLADAYEKEGFIIENYVPMPTRGVSDEVRASYRNRKYEEERNGHVIIHRFSMFREGKNPLLRAIRYVLVNLIQYWKGIHAKDIDVILAGSTPPTQGLLCALVKKRLKVPFVYNLQDIFPDSMVNAGMTREGSWLWKIGRKMEDFTYRNADRIIVISEDFRKNLLAKGVPEAKITVIPNWVDENEVVPVPREMNKIFDELSLPRDKFCVTYAGNIGESQGIDIILDAAFVLQEYHDIIFVVFGGGPLYPAFLEKANDSRLKNLKVFSLQGISRISEVYSLGDVSVVACKKGVGAAALPSKTWSIMAAGRPVLASFDRGSELERILHRHNCGYLVEAGDTDGFVRQVLWFAQNLEKVDKMGKNARQYVLDHLTMKKNTEKYVDAIMKA